MLRRKPSQKHKPANLQGAFVEGLRNAVYRAGCDLICAKLEAEGITLTEREKRRLTSYLKNGNLETFKFRRWSWNWWKTKKIQVLVDESDLEALTAMFCGSEAQERATRALQSTAEQLAQQVLKAGLQGGWAKALKVNRSLVRNLRKHLRTRWGAALDHLDMLLGIAREAGAQATVLIREELATECPALADVLPRLHARACQVASEILSLLEAGFSDGAMARWRTLHEISVVCMLLYQKGEPLAQRYAHHDVIESFRAARDYKACSERLGYEPMDESEYERVQAARKAMLDKYGKDFNSMFGWAAEIAGKTRPTIRDLEELAELGHLRAHYRMASHNVHANPKGVFFKLGLLSESEVLLTGPSDIGIVEPGHSAAISLMHASSALLLLRPTLDLLVAQKILMKLVDETGELFLAAQGSDRGTEIQIG